MHVLTGIRKFFCGSLAEAFASQARDVSLFPDCLKLKTNISSLKNLRKKLIKFEHVCFLYLSIGKRWEIVKPSSSLLYFFWFPF